MGNKSVAGLSGNLAELPDELILHFLSFLLPRNLARAASTCRRLRTIVNDSNLWHLEEIAQAYPDPLERAEAFQRALPCGFFRQQHLAHVRHLAVSHSLDAEDASWLSGELVTFDTVR